MNSYVRPQVARTWTACSPRCGPRACKTEVDILRSDAGVMTPAEAARNPVYGVLSRAVGRRRGRALRGRAGGLPERADVRHGRDVDRRVAVPGGGADDRARDDDRPVPDQGARASTCTPSAPAAARSRTCPQLTGALRVGPQSAGAEPGAGGVRAGRRGADRDRRQRRARAPAGRPDRRRDVARRRGRAGGGAARSPTRWASRSRRPRTASCGSSTRTWRARCA